MRLHVAVAGMADMLARLLRCEGAGGALPGAALVDPQIAHDPIHPAIQSRSRLPLIACPERLFQRRLAEIVRIGTVPRQAGGKAPQRSEERSIGKEWVSTG